MNISNDVTNTRKISSQVVNFIIATQTNKYNCFNIDDARGVNIPNNKIDEVVINKYELLHDISLLKPNQSDITVLVESDQPELLLNQEFNIGKPGDPVAVQRKLSSMLMRWKQQLVDGCQCNYLSKDNIYTNLENIWQNRYKWRPS